MNDPVTSEELKNQRCPKCGQEMKQGFVAGKGLLWWTEKEKTMTLLGVNSLRKKIDWWHAPTLEAVRCEVCKIGVFRYDY